MPIYEILVALGVVAALVADSLTVAEGLWRIIQMLRRWWRKHKRD